jgi:hypothetical protein
MEAVSCSIIIFDFAAEVFHGTRFELSFVAFFGSLMLLNR